MMSDVSVEGLIALAERSEAASGAERALDREIAVLAGGWHRYSPSQIRRKNPGWISPEDFSGELSSANGPTPILDSLHGTTIYREPPAYTASLDAAMSLLDPTWFFHVSRFSPDTSDGGGQAHVYPNRGLGDDYEAEAATPALALCAAALRARALGEVA